jgi:hypothetical protein
MLPVPVDCPFLSAPSQSVIPGFYFWKILKQDNNNRTKVQIIDLVDNTTLIDNKGRARVAQ